MTRTLREEFHRYLGPVPVVVAFVASVGAGAASVALLRRRDWGFVDILDLSARGVVGASVAAAGLAIVASVADRTIGFAADINVPWPRAFVFYPIVAVIAEAGFHLVPLAALAVGLRLQFAEGLDPTGYACLAVVALTETSFQVVASRRAGARTALVVFVGVHLLVIGAAQMMLLWRFGVVAMLLFRFVYYACWHVVWGRLRLADS